MRPRAATGFSRNYASRLRHCDLPEFRAHFGTILRPEPVFGASRAHFQLFLRPELAERGNRASTAASERFTSRAIFLLSAR